MKNNYGFGKFEILTVLVLMLVIFAGLMYFLLGGVSNQKIDTMKENALNFSKSATTNISSFHNVDVVYLQEAIDQEVFTSIRNPFGGGNCDPTQSRINYRDGKAYSTLKCGKYLIDEAVFNDKEKVPVYEVSEWSSEKSVGADVETRLLYNCTSSGKEVFDNYYEEPYFVYVYNKKFNDSVYLSSSIKNSDCIVVSKLFYRTKKVIN